jgi:competence protein ComFB
MEFSTSDYDFSLVENESERLVFEELQRQLNNDESICRCEECVTDMFVMALNNVKPLYHHSLLGGLYAAAAKDDPVYSKSLKEAVSGAIEKVRKNPDHDLQPEEPEEVEKTPAPEPAPPALKSEEKESMQEYLRMLWAAQSDA